MVWFLRGSSPIVLSHRIVGARNGASIDHSRKCGKVDLDAEIGEDLHRQVVVIRPSGLRHADRESARQGGKSIFQAVPNPIWIRPFLVPNLVALGETPSVRMPSNLVPGIEARSPELREFVGEVSGVTIGVRNLLVCSEHPREPNVSSIEIANVGKEAQQLRNALAQPFPSHLSNVWAPVCERTAPIRIDIYNHSNRQGGHETPAHGGWLHL